MRRTLWSALTLTAALAAAPLVAQTSPSQAAAGADTVHHVTGTIASDSGGVLVVKIDSAPGEPESVASSMVGTLVSFTLASSVEQPADMRNGDRVDVWYTSKNDQRTVTRVAEAGPADAPPAVPASGNEPAAGASGSQAAGATSPGVSSSSSKATVPDQQADQSGQARPSASTEGRLPKTASELPLIGLAGLAALGIAGGLRFASRL